MPADLVADLLLTPQKTQLLSAREMLPVWLRSSAKDVWDLRVVDEGKPFPPTYHRSLQLPMSHAKAKRLDVPVIREGDSFRRLSKWEILHSMGMSMDVTIPLDEETAISLIGESFPPIHAAHVIAPSAHHVAKPCGLPL